MRSIWYGGTNFGINSPVIKGDIDFIDYGLLENKKAFDETTLQALDDISKDQVMSTEEVMFGKRKVSRKLI